MVDLQLFLEARLLEGDELVVIQELVLVVVAEAEDPQTGFLKLGLQRVRIRIKEDLHWGKDGFLAAAQDVRQAKVLLGTCCKSHLHLLVLAKTVRMEGTLLGQVNFRPTNDHRHLLVQLQNPGQPKRAQSLKLEQRRHVVEEHDDRGLLNLEVSPVVIQGVVSGRIDQRH